MKYDELVDLTQNILQTNYLSTYRLNLSDETFEHIDMGLRSDILNLKDTSDSFRELFQKAQPGKIYFNTDIFRCTFVYLLLPALFCLKKFKGNVLTKFLPLFLFRKN